MEYQLFKIGELSKQNGRFKVKFNKKKNKLFIDEFTWNKISQKIEWFEDNSQSQKRYSNGITQKIKCYAKGIEQSVKSSKIENQFSNEKQWLEFLIQRKYGKFDVVCKYEQPFSKHSGRHKRIEERSKERVYESSCVSFVIPTKQKTIEWKFIKIK